VRGYRLEGADTVVVALGSALGTIEDVVDELRDAGEAVGALAVRCFRPWPADDVRAALAGAQRIVVVEKAFAVGAGGIVGQNVRLALEGLPVVVHDVVAGLGGRAITSASLRAMLGDALAGRLGRMTFMDLDVELVERELARGRDASRTGPHAENMLRDMGIVAHRAT